MRPEKNGREDSDDDRNRIYQIENSRSSKLAKRCFRASCKDMGRGVFCSLKENVGVGKKENEM
jgi:hypothetical protein